MRVARLDALLPKSTAHQMRTGSFLIFDRLTGSFLFFEEEEVGGQEEEGEGPGRPACGVMARSRPRLARAGPRL
jgi:hypothetical protein